MKLECIDSQAYEFYYHWRYEDEEDKPFLYDYYSEPITWEKFDQGFDTMPEDVQGW